MINHWRSPFKRSTIDKRDEMRERCEYCGGIIICYRGEYVCEKCGDVKGPVFVTPITEGSISDTQISAPEAIGGIIERGKYETNIEERRRIYDFRLRISDFYGDYKVIKEIIMVAEKLNLSTNVRDRAIYIYRKISKENVKSTKPVLAIASIIASARENRTYVQPKKVCEIFKQLGHKVSMNIVLRRVNEICSKMRIKVKKPGLEEYVKDIIRLLRISFSEDADERYFIDLEKEALKIAAQLPKFMIIGRNPRTLASAIVYAAYRRTRKQGSVKVTQEKLAEIAHVGKFTLREHYSMIKKKIGMTH